MPPKPETTLTLIIAAAHWALSLTLFSCILFSLSYAARRNYSSLMTVVSIMSLAFVFCFSVSTALDYWKAVPPAQSTGIMMGSNGLILYNAHGRNETAVVLLKGTSEPLGPRVTAIPGQPMAFLEAARSGGTPELPPVAFGDDTPWFLESLSIDIRLNAEMIKTKFNEGFGSFLIYAGSLIFLLCSLGHAIKFSAWPLPNLFLGILAFCGVLSLETFLNSPEMLEILDSYLKGRIPVAAALPLLFFGFGLLLHLYSILTFAAKRRESYD
ncbi:MAG: hypothetical protein LBI12_00760 [Treponema sp.]|nr:hypothetical protein [Treponema sp.]